jgi:threonyl-tRNA synthetase
MSSEQDKLYAMRHSLAHIMATATMKLHPGAKLGVGPVVDNGFYYDIDIEGVTISEKDFKQIEKEMRAVINRDETFEKSEKAVDEAIQWAKEAKQPYKEELLNDLKRSGTTIAKDLDVDELGLAADGDAKIENVSFYTNGDFTDLCRGPHVESTGKVGAFKLMRVAGAYWRGKEGNPQMQRLYGVAFETQEQLDEYLKMFELAKERDHRKLGKELDLFTFSPMVGAGLPLFTTRGTVLRELLNQYSQELRLKEGFQKVWVPHITKKDLYEASGHWAKFGDELFLVKSQETSDELVMKPMNCPHHTQLFAAKPRTYRDLPLYFMETTTVYRDEKSGELGGLSRVRSITQDDSHTFCEPDQIKDVLSMLTKVTQEFYGQMGMKLRARLSYRDDGDGYLGEPELWDRAQGILEEVAKEQSLDYFVVPGEAAFYGPKIDFMATDALGREHQLATPQLDFVQPERFGLKYTASNGELKTPVMIHFALLGSIERFLSVYIEHTGGWFPFWVAPEQLRIVTVNETVSDYVQQVTKVLDNVVLMSPVKYNELRYTVDNRNESLGKKIREASKMKIPVQLVIGPQDAEAGEVSVRLQDGEHKVKLADLAKYLQELK